jgi:hypothetical protein
MSNYQFTSDLLADALFRAGEPTDGSSDYNAQALTYLNRAYREVWMGGGAFDPTINETWWWLRKDPPGTLTLVPAVTAGTVVVTNGSTSITFSVGHTPTVATWFFRVDGHPDLFRIATHTAGSGSATLDGAYTGASDIAATYTLFKLEYTLASDVLRLVSPMRVQAGFRSRIDGIDIKTLDAVWPLVNVSAEVPFNFAPVTESKVRFSHYPTAQTRVEYDYIQHPAALTNAVNEEPLIPLHYRHILSDIAVFYLLADKNDSRIEGIGVAARAALTAMAKENRHRSVVMSSQYGAVMPRPLEFNTRILRTESGAIIGWT